MSYLLTQLWLSLSIAAIIGGVLGWILRGGCKKYITNIKNLESKLSKLEKENVLIKQKWQKLKSIARERNVLFSRFEKVDDQKKAQHAKLLKMKGIVKKTSVSYAHMATKLTKAKEMLVFAKQAQQNKDMIIEQIKKESTATEHLLMRCQEDWDAKHRVLRSQRDVSLLNQKAAEEKMSLAVNKLTEAEESLNAVESNLASTQSKIRNYEESESIMIEQEAGFEAKIEELASRLKQEKQKVEDVSKQLNTFKVEAKHYVGSISKENKNYINIVDRLEEDIEEGRLAVKEKDEKLEVTNVELASNKKELITLKRQLQALTVSSKVSSSSFPESDFTVGSDKSKMNLRHGKTTEAGLASRWRLIKKSRFRRRPR